MAFDSDLIIVGAGPAGCAAAVMAASLGMRTILIESAEIGAKMRAITSMRNVLGGFRTGPALADAMVGDIAAAEGCTALVGHAVSDVHADDDSVTVGTHDGRTFRAPYVIVATGVRARRLTETGWITVEGDISLPSLWAARQPDIEDREVLVLGADRPLGTVLRTHSEGSTRFLALYPVADEYKTSEVRRDPRVTLLQTTRLTIFRSKTGAIHVAATDPDGQMRTFAPERTYTNLGSVGAAPAKSLVVDQCGYCPPDRQHPRILIAGDLRSAHNQRIMTAFGTGSEAALKAYYETCRQS